MQEEIIPEIPIKKRTKKNYNNISQQQAKNIKAKFKVYLY
jgi:glutamate formiminotransferase